MKIRLAVAAMFFHISAAMTQAPAIQWARCLGGTDGEVGRCIRQTRDTGYIVAGNSGSDNGDVYKNAGSEDVWIVKLNKAGDTVWTRVFGGSNLDFAMAVQQTEDDGFIVAAQSNSPNGDFTGGRSGNYDCWIMKLDKAGTTQWKKQFGGTGNDVPRDILITADGGFLIAGSSDSRNGDVVGNRGGFDYWLLRLNKTGDIVWTKCYGGTGSDQAFSVCPTSDNGYLLAGQSDSKNGDVWGNHGKIDYWILKLNSTGDTTWTMTLGGSQDDFGHAIQQTTDGGIIAGGASKSNNGDVSGHHGDSTKADIWVVKLNSNRMIQWQKSLGGTLDEGLYGTLLAFSMIQTTDGGNIVSTYTGSNDGDVAGNKGSSDVWLFKLAANGNLEWQKTLGGTGTDYGFSVRNTIDGGYVLSGQAGNNSGDVTGHRGSADFWIVKFNGNTAAVRKPLISVVSVYPNPSAGSFTIENAPPGGSVSITDIAGKLLYNIDIIHERLVVDLPDVSNGAYILKVEKSGTVSCHKLLIQK